MLLPFCGLPVPQEPKPLKPIQQRNVIGSDDAYQADSSSSSQEEQVDELELTGPRYKVPQRRNQKPDKQMEFDSSSNENPTETEVTHKDARPQEGSTRDNGGQDSGEFQPQSGVESSTEFSFKSSSPVQEDIRRGTRRRQSLQWMRDSQSQIQHQPYTISVDPFQVVILSTESQV